MEATARIKRPGIGNVISEMAILPIEMWSHYLSRPFINRLPEGIDHSSNHLGTNGNAHNAVSPLNFVTFFNKMRLSQKNDADIFFFEVQNHSRNAVRKFKQLSGERVFQAPNAGDPVPDLEHVPDLLHLRF